MNYGSEAAAAAPEPGVAGFGEWGFVGSDAKITGTMPEDPAAQKQWKYCIVQLHKALKDAKDAPGLHEMFEHLHRAAEIVDPVNGLEFTIDVGERACAFFHKTSPVALDADGLVLHCDGLTTALLFFV